MAKGEVIAYNVATFLCALFVLEFGADKFIDHTAIVAERTGIPQTVIGLLTAGAEWEELAVVVVSISRHRSSLAVGNIVGSTISNILGAFSLGLIFRKDESLIIFDRSSKIYTLLLLLLTLLVAGLLSEFDGHHNMWRIVGVIAIGLFSVYLASIAWFIAKGRITAPELSDSGSDSDGDSCRDEEGRRISHDTTGSAERIVTTPTEETPLMTTDTIQCRNTTADGTTRTPSQCSALVVDLIRRDSAATPPSEAPQTHSLPVSLHGGYKHSVLYHIGFLLLGFLAVVLSSYVLSQAASNLVDETGVSDVLFGVVVLSIATTLPEKLVAVMSGYRGHAGILVANTVGSNIFLLSLCMGILWVSTGGSFDQGSVNAAELGVMLGSTIAMTFTVWRGARWSRLLGAIMLSAYIVFLVLEFTLIRKV